MCPDDQGADGVSMEDLAARLVHPVHWTFATHHRINLQGGGLLKERKCRSGAQYFSAAKQRHREADHPWTGAWHLAVQLVARSVNRGLRGATSS